MTYAEIIKRIRGQRKSKEFAKLLGVDPSLISLWESGQREPSKALLAALFYLAAPADKVALVRAVFNDPHLEVILYDRPEPGKVQLYKVEAQQ